MFIMKTPELILPAGDLNKTKFAFMYGADSVYGGLAHYSLRKAEINFTYKSLGEAIDHAHGLKKKFYITLNIFPKNSQINTLKKEIKKLAKLNPDAFIISDPGLIQVSKKLAPKIRIHLSTQANSLNYETIKFWKSQGIKRVVLARELTLEEITEIKKKVPGIELEAFVHGAMCISYSGRCLMSSIMTGRESNQGLCTQPCRWQYKVHLEEAKRPGEYFPVEEDENGTYIMNSKDLRLIEYLDELRKAGISSFKIEGRNKSEYYVAVVARAYRKAIETNNIKELKKLSKELETLNYRDYTTGFILGKAKKGETYNDRAPIKKYDFVGVLKENKDKLYKIEVRNKIRRNDNLELITPDEIIKFKIKDFYNLRKEKVIEAHPGNKNSFIYAELPKVPLNTLIRKKI